jgi:hypothetical protein
MVPRSAGSLLAPFRVQVETMDYQDDADGSTADRAIMMGRGTLPSYDSDGPRWPMALARADLSLPHTD